MAARTVSTSALHATGNCQGGYYFMSLLISRVLNRLHATPLPMPAEVIDRKHALAEAQDIEPDLAFGNRNNHIVAQPYPEPDNVDEDLDDPTFKPSHDENDVSLAYDSDNIEESVPDLDEDAQEDIFPDDADYVSTDNEEPLSTAAMADEDNDDPSNVPAVEHVDKQQLDNDDHDPVNDITVTMDAAYGPHTSLYNLRQ